MKILIVEDDAILAMLAAELLEDEGFQVVGPAHSVDDALVLVAGNKPDLALVDINLAGYNEGVGLARMLNLRAVPSVFVSGQVAAAYANRDAALGLLRKPYDPEDLARVPGIVKQLLAGYLPPPPPIPASMEIFSAPSV